MKKYILTALIALAIIGFFQAGILRALMMFLLVGAIPGTTHSLSPDIMASILVAISISFVLAQLGVILPRLVTLYRRNLLRKNLLTIPAFRRLIRIRQA